MRYLSYLVCLLLAVVVGCSNQNQTGPETPPPTSSPAPAVDTPEASAGAENAAAVADDIVIDVRSQEEWNAGHVAQAVRIPHTEIAERIGEVTSDKDAKIVLYCAVGGRAGKAKAALEELGFTNVENAGGYDDVKQRYE